MIRRPPRSTRTDTPFPYTTRFRSRGIVHSEMPEQEDGLLQGFQLWVNLPAADKMTAPRYQDIEPEAIPEVDAGGGVRVRVIAGTVGAVKGAVDTGVTEPTYLDVHLPRSEEHTSELQSLMRISYAVFCLKKKKAKKTTDKITNENNTST